MTADKAGFIPRGGGHSLGWYSVDRETWQQSNGFARAFLDSARLSYERRRSGQVPPFVLFEWTGGDALSPRQDDKKARAVPPGSPPPQVMAESAPMQLPLEFGGPLTLVGYQVRDSSPGGAWVPGLRKPGPEPPPPETDLELWTWWRVDAPADRPLSIMAHLVAADGRPIAVADGLGVLSDQWEVGDVFVQRHRFAYPDDTPAGPYWLQTGAYWLDTMERWPVVRQDTPIGDALLLTEIEKP